MTVVCDNSLNPGLFGDSAQNFIGQALLFDAVILQLEKEVLFTEDIEELLGGAQGRGLLVPQDLLIDLALEAGRETDQSFAVLAQEVVVDSWLVVEAFQVGLRGQLDEISISDLVPDQKH